MVTLDDIILAQTRLRGACPHTPLLPNPRQEKDRLLFFKAENFQPIGSFKLRGAYNKIASLSDEERKRGVIGYSSGNHAQGVAYAARALGVKAILVMPSTAPKVKLESTRAMGAEVVVVGPGSSERLAKAEELARQHGYVIVPPYNDEKIIAGQGTIGLEIFQDMPEVETVLAPIGGGGMVSGIATALKMSKHGVKVIGVEPEMANDAQQSFRAGRLVEIPAEQTTRTIADGLRTQSIGAIPFEHIRKYVDDVVTVSEAEIIEAVRRMVMDAKLVAEPSGAVTFAAFLFHRDQLPRTRYNVAVISGGNIEPHVLARIMTEQPALAVPAERVTV